MEKKKKKRKGMNFEFCPMLQVWQSQELVLQPVNFSGRCLCWGVVESNALTCLFALFLNSDMFSECCL